MRIFNRFRKQKTIIQQTQHRNVQYLDGRTFTECISSGYTTMDNMPEVVSACFRVAQLISSMTIYLMANTENGDVRINNELSRKIDIEPHKNMTRSTWMTAIMMNLLLYGDGNSIVYPHTNGGLLGDLEPISPDRVGFLRVVGTSDYYVTIDNQRYAPSELLHFVMNPRKDFPFIGCGFRQTLKQVVETLAQAQATTKGFMQSKWKPSIIVKVDAMTDEFASPEGRKRLLDDYIGTEEVGAPWLIPAEQFSVEQIRPLSLSDLAVNDTVTLDKKTVAAVLGVPPFVLGVGEYKQDEWNSFISNTIRPIAQSIEQEMTRKLIVSPRMFLAFNMSKLYSYDLKTLSDVYGGLYDKGIVTGNEVREKLYMQPKETLDKLIVLENYIPVDKIGEQKKLGGTE